jgi:hypothetical protein
MNSPSTPNWFIDIRQLATPEHISLDLSRHLPRRAAVGSVAVITDRPSVLLSVVKKRWSIIIHEVQRQYSSTLQPVKKQGLQRELARLQSYQFAISSKRTVATSILFAPPQELLPDDYFATIYLTIPLDYQRLDAVVAHIRPGGFLVTYTGWPERADNS